MIQINKGLAPASLITNGTTLKNDLSTEYLLHKKAYKTGKKVFTFTEAYKTDDVKNKLLDVQHNKCCFSEAKFVNDYFHVEHFRPKGRVDKWPNGLSSYPGYYWLAYEWSNLFLAKGKTNTSFKRNFFPLKGNISRNRTHLDNKIENNILIDPSVENPRIHIGFKKEEIYGKTSRGKKNIEILNLRNPDIDEARRTKYRMLFSLKTAIDLLIATGSNITDPKMQIMIEPLRDAVKPQAEFSSMAIDLLSAWPHL